MKSKWRFLFILFAFSIFQPANAEAGCDSCNKMNELMQKNDVDAAARFMNNFKFSNDPTTIQSEAMNISRLAAKFIPLDQSGDIDEFYYGIYNKQPEAMEYARNHMTAKDLAILKKSYNETSKVHKKGNGQNEKKTDEKVAAQDCPKGVHSSNVSPSAIGSITKAITSSFTPSTNSLSASNNSQATQGTAPTTPAGGAPLDIRPSVQKNSRGPASVAPSYSPSYDSQDSSVSQ